MSSINALKDKISTKTSNMLLLTMATGGLYPLLWIYRNYPIINEETEAKTIDDTFAIWLTACFGLSQMLIRMDSSAMILVGLLLSVAANVLYVVCAFKMKSALQEYALQKHKLDLRMNGFYTLLFSVYYINYCINDLEEVERKWKILEQRKI